MNLKDRIADVFLELVKKKSIDKITIKNIVEQCGITRQSFYYHFSDIFNLIEWIMQREFRRLLAEISQYDDQKQCVKRLLESTYEKRGLMQRLTNTKEQGTVIRSLINTTGEFLKRIANPKMISNISAAELDMTLNFYSFAITGFILGLHNHMGPDMERAADHLLKLIRGESLLIPDQSVLS